MASAKTTEVFPCTVEQFYAIITDYENYPEFLSEVKQCRVVGEENGQKVVEYDVSMIKNFSYRLAMTEEVNKKVSWSFESGDIFKSLQGYWELEDEAGKCRATYSVEAKFNLFVPGPVAKALVNVNLPNMMSSYHKRVAELYG
ncbi:MAG: SRPBCC family protein [Pseudobdellovibrionaceae bacterium]|nr:SRPBCC family protein [Bdellovibrionales bacterium]USN48369.1 MAG: SRPBCC family protein [Pseudobdellovibrionaceae bacterium]